MEAKLLSSIGPKPSFLPDSALTRAPRQTKLHKLRFQPLLPKAASGPTNGSTGGDDGNSTGGKGDINTSNNKASAAANAASLSTQPRPPVTPLNIRYRSRNKARQQKEEAAAPPPPPPPKVWEEMTLGEKAVELYVGEKGLLFWLNKFAYASIFIIIGGWILFRFVGPALDLYQLDAPPLSPSNIMKG